MQINLDYITDLLTKLEQRDWSSLTVITERDIENANLKSVVIPEGVKEIGIRVFSYCRSLTSVVIPEGVTTIGDDAFRYCISLTSMTLPESVKEIGSETFSGCKSLTSVTIPQRAYWIGADAFKDCPNVTIHAPAGSNAEKYAKANRIPCRPLEEDK